PRRAWRTRCASTARTTSATSYTTSCSRTTTSSSTLLCARGARRPRPRPFCAR
ncbi:unnamed protein product, partial [Heterosigma akashiwo]